MRDRLLLSALFSVALVAPSRSATAAGYSLAHFGGIFGHPNSDGGLALHWNPARLSVGTGTFLTLDASLVIRDAEYTRVMTEDTAVGPVQDEAYYDLNSGRATLSNVGVLPYVAAGTSGPAGPIDLAFALGVVPAYGGGASWDLDLDAPAEYPGAVYGPQRWSAIESSLLIVEYTVGGSIAHRGSGVRLGATLAYATGHVESTRSRNVDGSDTLVDERGALVEGRILFQGRGDALTWAAGASYDIAGVALSAVYHSAYRIEMIGPLQQAYTTLERTQVEAFLEFPIPHVFNTSVSAEFGPLTLTGATDYTTWSVVNSPRETAEGRRCPGNDTLVNETRERLLCIPRNLDDTLGVRVLGEWRISNRVALGGSVGVDPSAVPEETMAADLPDSFKVRTGLGAEWALHEHFLLRGSYAHDFFRDREVTTSIHEPHANGSYSESREWVNLSLEGRY